MPSHAAHAVARRTCRRTSPHMPSHAPSHAPLHAPSHLRVLIHQNTRQHINLLSLIHVVLIASCSVVSIRMITFGREVDLTVNDDSTPSNTWNSFKKGMIANHKLSTNNNYRQTTISEKQQLSKNNNYRKTTATTKLIRKYNR